MDKSGFIVCQIGAREHYALPRALHRQGLLQELVTDVWVPPRSGFSCVPGGIGTRLQGRYEPSLESAKVKHFTGSTIGYNLAGFARQNTSPWRHTIARNELFQKAATRHLRLSGALRQAANARPVVFAYAYAARQILEEARRAGATAVLGQIDGGLGDEQFMRPIWSKHADIVPPPGGPPESYWDNWRTECHLADSILVNSSWSRDLLVKVGIDRQKIAIVPVIYHRQSCDNSPKRQYPPAFTAERPLRVLFLGSLVARKGVIEALQAAAALCHEPVEFWFVGADPHGLSVYAKSIPNVTWTAAVPRSEVSSWYRRADVFLFPTHSDGFGMTQLEAMESGLPVIASRNCAAVVEPGSTGLLLEEVSSDSIVRAVGFYLEHPEKLIEMNMAALAAGAAYARRSATAFLDAMQEIAARSIDR